MNTTLIAPRQHSIPTARRLSEFCSPATKPASLRDESHQLTTRLTAITPTLREMLAQTGYRHDGLNE